MTRPDSSQVSNEEDLHQARETRATSPQLTCAHPNHNKLKGRSRNPHLDPASAATLPPHRQPRLPTPSTTQLLPPEPAAAEAAECPHARCCRDHPGRRAQRHGSDRHDRQPLEHASRAREHTRWALASHSQSRGAQGPRRAESVWGRSRARRRSSRECGRAWRSGCRRT